jgi:FkbM family methyltransferase
MTSRSRAAGLARERWESTAVPAKEPTILTSPQIGSDSPSWGSLRPGTAAALCIDIVKHRIIRGALRKPVYRLLAKLSPAYDIETSTGLRLRCSVGDNVTEMRALGRPERLLTDVARITGQLVLGDTFVDLGANVGVFSLYAAKAVGPQGCVLAIEPAPAMLERLRFNLNANGFKNVRIAAVAVGEARGEAIFHTLPDAHGSSSLHEMPGSTPQMTVPVEPLLSLLSVHGIERIDAMKVDIEGYEDRALIPFFADAPRSLWPRRIFIETLGRGKRWQRDCVAHLLSLGYKKEWQGKKDALLALPSQGAAAPAR